MLCIELAYVSIHVCTDNAKQTFDIETSRFTCVHTDGGVSYVSDVDVLSE